MEGMLEIIIGRMESREKAYFKRFVMNHSESNIPDYIKIFEHFAGIKKHELSRVKNLARKKNYLANLIIKSLISYNENTIESIQMRNSINSFEVLHSKGIIADEFYGRIGNKNTSDLALSLGVLAWDKRIAITKGNTRMYREALETERMKLDIQNEIHLLEVIYADVFDLAIQKKWYGHADFFIKCREILKVPELSGNRKFLSPLSEALFYRIKSVIHNFLGEKMPSFRCAMKRIAILESNSVLVEMDPQNYINALSNAMEASLVLGKVNEFLGLEKKMAGLLVNGIFLKTRKEIRSIMNHLQYIIVSCDYKLLQKNKERFHFVEEHQSQIIRQDEVLEIRFLLTVCFVNKKEFKNADREIYSFLKLPKSNVRTDIQSYMRLMDVFVHFRLGKVDILDYVLRNVYNYLRERKELGVLEKMIFRFCKEELDGKSSKEIDLQLIQMQEALDLIQIENNLDIFSLVKFRA
jgi:hypothetical protein